MAVPAHHTANQEPALVTARVLGLTTALFLVGAGLVHLALVESHLSDDLLLGISFAVVGGAQVILGFVVLAKPSRRVLYLVGALSLVAVAVWAVSRTFGLPVGSHQIPEPVGITDLTVVIFEILTVAAVVLLTTRTKVLVGLSNPRSLMVAPLTLAVAALASTAVALEGSEQTSHSHDDSVVNNHDLVPSDTEPDGPLFSSDDPDTESSSPLRLDQDDNPDQMTSNLLENPQHESDVNETDSGVPSNEHDDHDH